MIQLRKNWFYYIHWYETLKNESYYVPFSANSIPLFSRTHKKTEITSLRPERDQFCSHALCLHSKSTIRVSASRLTARDFHIRPGEFSFVPENSRPFSGRGPSSENYAKNSQFALRDHLFSAVLLTPTAPRGDRKNLLGGLIWPWVRFSGSRNDRIIPKLRDQAWSFLAFFPSAI